MSEKICPLIKGACLEHKCMLYTHVLGLHPQTGKEIDNWDCSLAWIPMLLIENSKIQRETGAAVESMRNEVNAGAGEVLARIMGAPVDEVRKLK